MAEEYIPEVDTSYGLIYRLNYLWARVDREALSGNFDKWELVLDRIFSNLLYREDVEIKKNGRGEVDKVELTEKDVAVWRSLKRNIREAKRKVFLALRKRNVPELMNAKGEHYQALMLYDVWLRKFMQELRLYMKESERNPSTSLFGGAFEKKKGGKKK